MRHHDPILLVRMPFKKVTGRYNGTHNNVVRVAFSTIKIPLKIVANLMYGKLYVQVSIPQQTNMHMSEGRHGDSIT